MDAPQKSRPRRWTRKRTAWLIVGAAAVVVAAVVALPELLPQAALRREVTAVLQRQLGRPVTIESASFRWGNGLRINGLRVGRGGEEGETPLATARRLTIRFDPLDAAQSLGGSDMPLESVRAEGLELWLILDREGRLNVEDLSRGGERKDIRNIQVSDARVHFENRRDGQSVTLENVNASLGELLSNGRGYASLSADLAGEEPGHFIVTANLDRLDLGGKTPPAGSLKAEWTNLAWPEVCAMATQDPDLARRLSRTSGRMSATFGHGAWSAEGAVEADDLALGGRGPDDEIKVPQAILGFQLRQPADGKPLEIGLAKFSAPGIDVKVSGTVRLEAPAGGETGDTGAPRWKVREAELRAGAAVTWVPLCEGIAPLERLAKQFEHLGGKARADLEVKTTSQGHQVTASADLTDTLAVRTNLLNKQEHQTLRLEVMASCPDDFRTADVKPLTIVCDGGRVEAEGRVPLADLFRRAAAPKVEAPAHAADDLGRRLAGSRLEVRGQIRQTETLLELAPALRLLLGTVEASGPLQWRLACVPADAADVPAGSPPAWTVRFSGDLTGTTIEVPRGASKPAAKTATISALAVVSPDARRIDVRRAAISLDRGALRWDGSARVEWPPAEGALPSGRFEGVLEVSRVESLGAVLAPQAFASAPPPASGDVGFDVVADLANRRLQAHLEASLEQLAVSAKDYFVKAAGQPASLTLTGVWESGERHHVEASADITMPAARLTALGRSEVQVHWLDLSQSPPDEPAKPAPAGDGPPPQEARQETPAPRSAVHVALVPTSTLELRAEVSDLAKAAEVSPVLARALKGRGAEGAAEATLVLAMGKQTLEARGSADLTRTAIDLGPYLKKPPGRLLKIDLAASAAPPAGQSVELRLANVEARLGESVARASGRVRLSQAGLASSLKGTALLTALVEEADVAVNADWNHNPALRESLPWLEPIYARCGLSGPTTWTLAFSGTPIRGRVRLDADATACRVTPAGAAGAAAGAAGETVLKEAGVPATIGMEISYGEVPGEMVLDRLAAKLADATADVKRRLLFDDPRLTVLAPPAAWSFRIQGRVPDAAILASLLPARLADLKPTGSVTLDLVAAADAKATQVESCRLGFDKARVVWLGKPVLLDGPISFDRQRLATENLHVVAGGSDFSLVAYIADPKGEPTGSVVVRGRRLDLKGAQDLVRETSEYLASLSGPATGKPKPPGTALSEVVARRAQRLLAEAQLSVEVALDSVALAVPQWNTTYELLGLAAEGRLADRRLVVPRFGCSLNKGTISGEIVLDFRPAVPVLSYAYSARDLQMAENLKPFIDTTFPDMQVFGTLSTTASMTQPLAAGAAPVGRGETILTDGILEGPGAPEYIQAVLPGLKIAKYPFNRMSNVFENKPNGDADNRMIFQGKSYDIYIFGVSHPDGRTDYTLGVDLSVGVGSTVLSRTLDQGKLPLMRHTGRIAGSHFAERQVSYVLPHEFAYDVFVRKSLLLRVIRSLGEKEPEIKRPLVAPKEERRGSREG